MGLQPLSYIVEATKEIYTPPKVHDIHQFLGINIHHQEMCHKRANKISPIKKTCSTKVKFKLSEEEYNAFL